MPHCCQNNNNNSSSYTEALYFWTGRLAPFSLQDDAARVLFFIMDSLAFPGDFPVKTIDEGEAYGEEAALWDELCDDLGGECSYTTWDDLPDDYDPEDEEDEGKHIAQLFVSETGSGQVNLDPLPFVQQCNLYQGGVVLLQCFEALYVWRGIASSPRQHDLILRAARDFRRDGSVLLVSQGSEPAEFCAHFQTWSDWDMGGGVERSSSGLEGITYDGGFEDIYEKRISMLDSEGKLGDIRQLRGRVLGEEEAKSYWSGHTQTLQQEEKAKTVIKEGDLVYPAITSHTISSDLCERVHRRRGEAGSTKGVLRPTIEKGRTLSPKFVRMKSLFENKSAYRKNLVRSSYDPADVLVSRRLAIESGTVTERWGKENINHHLSSVEGVTQQQPTTKHQKGQSLPAPCLSQISAATSYVNDEGNTIMESALRGGETASLSRLAAREICLKPPKRGEGVGPHNYYATVLELNQAVNECYYKNSLNRHRSTRSAVALSLKEATAAARQAGIAASEAFGGVGDAKGLKKKKVSVPRSEGNVVDKDEISPSRYSWLLLSTPLKTCILKSLIILQPRLSRMASIATCDASAIDRETVFNNFRTRLSENIIHRHHRRMRTSC